MNFNFRECLLKSDRQRTSSSRRSSFPPPVLSLSSRENSNSKLLITECVISGRQPFLPTEAVSVSMMRVYPLQAARLKVGKERPHLLTDVGA